MLVMGLFPSSIHYAIIEINIQLILKELLSYILNLKWHFYDDDDDGDGHPLRPTLVYLTLKTKNTSFTLKSCSKLKKLANKLLYNVYSL